jgi:hypothetical protein
MPVSSEYLFQGVEYIKHPNLCVLCAAFDLDKLDTYNPKDHQPSFEALEISALNGCHICGLLQDALLQA